MPSAHNRIQKQKKRSLRSRRERFWDWWKACQKRGYKKLHAWRNVIPLLCIGIGLLFMGYSGVHFSLEHRALVLSASEVKTYQQVAPVHVPTPTHIFIKWFIDVDVSNAALVDGQWAVSPTTASYLVQSAAPGQRGNIIIYGHNLRSIMGNIRALKGGERVVVTTEDGAIHTYRVTQTTEVDPSDVRLLQPTKTETLTLYTCSGLLDSKRFIVRAVPL
ncbi:hypothetical protein C5B42_05760 [Candidatus Cerribacteria bacterium 'Amazon FNV 2010 28 9']|uniref:Sortase n=1 Tax=Candidatus Cerribacteria bacterium 'Amazon FNV 2010 28 9' TaxID=2081795 RepID=A0A317JM23_9BACT|nr:MAG: hypothetical protein C5B42_05760 [Candidatus Cerribacteria bacterium 'Amazon FNV 2010 28 9']